MKSFLKKLFYWDAPAEGAVFASLLFWLGGWCLATVFILFDGPVACSVLPRILQHWHMVEYPLAWQHLLPLAGLAVLIYYLIVTGHFYHAMIREKCRWGILIFSAIILVGAVTCVCLDSERMFVIFLYSMFCWVIPLCCLPKQWKWLIPAGFAPALIALPFIAFRDILESLLDTVGDPWLPSRLFASAAQLAVPSIVLGILCCLCGFKAYANEAGKPFRAMFGKGVTAVATVFLLTYGVSLGMAYSAHCRTKRHVAEMERFFGRPVNAQGLKELYYRNRKPDAAFWRKFEARYIECFKDFREDFPPKPTVILAPADLSAWKMQMEESSELRELETMFETEPPAFDREFRRGNIPGILLPELNSVRLFCELEAWRVHFAIDERKVSAALAAMDRMVKARNYLAHDPTMVLPSLVMIGLENIRLNALEQLLSSGLLTESQLIDQRNRLAEFRRQMPGIHARAVYGEAVEAMDLCDMFIYGRPAENPERDLTIPPFYPYRWLFPAGWFVFTRIRDVLAVNYPVPDFTRFPFNREKEARLKSTAHRAAGMLLCAWEAAGNKFHSLTARYLAMETLIGIELEKRRTGKYPDKLENPPVDPFGKPLLYRKGKMPYIQYQRTTETDQPYGKEKRITVDAVAVWSKGPNRKDDRGLSNGKENDKPTDDARAMIIFKKDAAINGHYGLYGPDGQKRVKPSGGNNAKKKNQ